MDMEFLPFLSVETLVCLYSYFNKKGKKRALNKKRSFSKKKSTSNQKKSASSFQKSAPQARVIHKCI
jgi:hypothetical protein